MIEYYFSLPLSTNGTTKLRFQDNMDPWHGSSIVVRSRRSTGVPKPINHTNRSLLLIARMYNLPPIIVSGTLVPPPRPAGHHIYDHAALRFSKWPSHNLLSTQLSKTTTGMGFPSIAYTRIRNFPKGSSITSAISQKTCDHGEPSRYYNRRNCWA